MHHQYPTSSSSSSASASGGPTGWPQTYGNRHATPQTPSLPAPIPASQTHYSTAYPNPSVYSNQQWTSHSAQNYPSHAYSGYASSGQVAPPGETHPGGFQPAFSSDLSSGVHGFGAAIPPPGHPIRSVAPRARPPSIRPPGTGGTEPQIPAGGPRYHLPTGWRGTTCLPHPPPPPKFPVKTFVSAGTQENPSAVMPVDADDPHGALKRIQMLAQHNCIEAMFNETAYEGKYKVTLSLGTETYEGTGTSALDAKHNAALQAVTNTHYRQKSTMKIRPENATPTSDLNVLASRKGLKMEFVFLEPANFVYNSAMKMWSKDDMRGNYRVKLEIAGMEFYGQADMPQLAKHNASRQALPVIQALPDMKDVLQQQALNSATTPSSSESGEITNSVSEPVAPTDATTELNRISMCRDIAPVWETVNESGPAHQKIFTLKCTLGEFSATGTAGAKKMAKSLAAVEILRKLPAEWKAPHQKTKKKPKKRKPQTTLENGDAIKKPCPNSVESSPAPLIGPVIPSSPAKSKKEDPPSGKRVYEIVQVANPICALYEYARRGKYSFFPHFSRVQEP